MAPETPEDQDAVCDAVSGEGRTKVDKRKEDDAGENEDDAVDPTDSNDQDEDGNDQPEFRDDESDEQEEGHEEGKAQSPNPSSSHHRGADVAQGHVKFFVGGLHPVVDEESLANYFKKYGSIVSTQVMRDFTTKRSRGFGFVTVVAQDNTDSVYTDYHVIDGKKVDVRHMQADPNLTIKRKIFVGGISRSLSENMLEEYFSNFGEVEKVTIMRQPDGSSRGFGFILFSGDGSAEKVLESPSHFVYGSKVDVRAAETRGKQYGARVDNSNQYGTQGGKRDKNYTGMASFPPHLIPGMAAPHAAGAYDPQLLQQQFLYQQLALQGQYAFFAQQQQNQSEEMGGSSKEQSRYMSYRSNSLGNQPYSQNNIARSYRHDPY
ncbi:RNA-binding (rrm/rbd/rnp motifs) family protein like protein [Babesia gibsoni]|uniref:RNA-binding (Rrm/rbd/rnp motifs) family protein like protein n=1 Tax=Babesia gibsoni TaxID=33632 RepID=A0AAD8PGH5_BABGI|nr:RNA-binding (rrm/rbd/rnp motifs) family protein like protein [Babesia gibsoni]